MFCDPLFADHLTLLSKLWSCFSPSPLITSLSENCLTKPKHVIVHFQRQVDRKMLPAVLSSFCICQFGSAGSSFVPFEGAHPFLYYDFTFLMWQAVMMWGCRESMHSIFLCLFLSNALSSWGLSRTSNIIRCSNAMVVSRQQGSCRSTRKHVCNSQ